MRLPGKRIVAIDIAPERVALAEVEPGRRPRLHAWAIVEGPFADASEMANRIREAYSAGGFTARLAYVAPGIPVGPARTAAAWFSSWPCRSFSPSGG